MNNFDPYNAKTWWRNVEAAFLKCLKENKGIFVDSETVLGIKKELMIYWVTASNPNFDLFDYRECHMWGTFDVEMITGDHALNSSENLDDSEVFRIGNIILDEKKWVPIQYAEVEDDYPIGNYHHEDRLVVIKTGESLPEGATKKFLYCDSDGMFHYTDGSPIIHNSEEEPEDGEERNV